MHCATKLEIQIVIRFPWDLLTVWFFGIWSNHGTNMTRSQFFVQFFVAFFVGMNKQDITCTTNIISTLHVNLIFLCWTSHTGTIHGPLAVDSRRPRKKALQKGPDPVRRPRAMKAALGSEHCCKAALGSEPCCKAALSTAVRWS